MMVTEASGSSISQETLEINTTNSRNDSENVFSSDISTFTNNIETIPEQLITSPADALTSNDGSIQTAVAQCFICIKVRTLEHRTHEIRISHNALVSELKDKIELELGVGSIRQRLIFRGKVMKNDQIISNYSLEDGHVIHLVVRSDTVPFRTDDNIRENVRENSAEIDVGSSTMRLNGMTFTGNNQYSEGQNRILMGTIAVPPGSNVDIPFLRSMIASMMIPARDDLDAEDIARGQEHAEIRMQPSSADAIGAIIASSLPAGTRGDDGEALSSLQARADRALNAMASNLDNGAYEFQNISHRTLPSNADERYVASLQTYLERLQDLFDRFRSRLHVLPIAIDAVRSQSDDPQTVIATMRAIRNLESLGEASQILCRIAQLLFLDSPAMSTNAFNGDAASFVRTSDRSDDLHHRDPRVVTRRARYVAVNANSGQSGSGSSNLNNSTRRSVTLPFARARAARAPSSWTQVPITPLQQVAVITPSPSISLPQHAPRAETPTAIFPFYLGSASITEMNWNFTRFFGDIFGQLPVSTAYGLLQGALDSVQQLLTLIREDLLNGVHFPFVNSLSANRWCDTLFDRAQRELNQANIPDAITSSLRLDGEQEFAAELLRPLRQSLPHLLEQILRPPSDSISDTSIVDMVRTMLQQWLTQLRQLCSDDDPYSIQQFFVDILAHFGIQGSVINFVIASAFKWLFPDLQPGLESQEGNSRRRHREQDAENAESSGVNSKRRCI